LVSAISYLKNKPQVRKQMGLNGHKAAIQKYNRKQIVDNFAEFLLHSRI
jgi:hypothetical protein